MDVEKTLKENKMRVTKNRISILKILDESDTGVTAEYIFKEVREKKEKIDLSTIYRTLEILYEKDILNKFDIGEGRYNYILKNKCHKHTICCHLCHKKIQIDCPLFQVEEIIKNKTGFTFVEKEIKLKCICEECRENETLDNVNNKEEWEILKSE